MEIFRASEKGRKWNWIRAEFVYGFAVLFLRLSWAAQADAVIKLHFPPILTQGYLINIHILRVCANHFGFLWIWRRELLCFPLNTYEMCRYWIPRQKLRAGGCEGRWAELAVQMGSTQSSRVQQLSCSEAALIHHLQHPHRLKPDSCLDVCAELGVYSMCFFKPHVKYLHVWLALSRAARSHQCR